jgi:hypothetical protein
MILVSEKLVSLHLYELFTTNKADCLPAQSIVPIAITIDISAPLFYVSLCHLKPR